MTKFGNGPISDLARPIDGHLCLDRNSREIFYGAKFRVDSNEPIGRPIVPMFREPSGRILLKTREQRADFKHVMLAERFRDESAVHPLEQRAFSHVRN